MNKKVLIIRNANFYDFGGGERFPSVLAVSLKKNNYHPVVVSRSPRLISYAKLNNLYTLRGLWWKKQNWSGYNNILIPLYFIWQFILYIWYLYIIIKNNPPVIHIQSKDDFIAGTLAGKTLNKKVIWTDHADLKHIFKNFNVWYKNPVGKIIYLCSLISDKVVVVSNEEKRLILNNLPKSNRFINKVSLIYNGVSDQAHLYKKNKKGVFSFGIATRLVVDKGIGEAIESFLKLEKKYKDIKLVIIGDGPDENTFKQRAKNSKNIVFTGHFDNPYSQMIKLDAFLHPTYHESFSMSIVEASMLGLPIIATNVGGNPEIIIDHKTGLLVNIKDVRSLYKAMEELYLDEKLRNKLAKEARKQYLEKFNFDDIVKNQYIPLYEK